MRFLPLISGALVPHAPVLLPHVAGPRNAALTEPLRAPLRAVDLRDPQVVVLLSPHGSRTGVYRGNVGRLDGFGVRGVELVHPSDDATARILADAWERPLVEDPVDHGVLVPLMLADLGGVPVVSAALGEGDTTADPVKDALSFVDALLEVAQGRRIAFIASANTAASLSERAPLSLRPGTKRLEAKLLRSLESDIGAVEDVARRLSDDGGSCSLGTLTAFARIFAHTTAAVVAYGRPFGVGYVVAVARS